MGRQRTMTLTASGPLMIDQSGESIMSVDQSEKSTGFRANHACDIIAILY